MVSDGADIVVVNRPLTDALDQHHHATQRIRADDPRVRRHPIVRMEWALLGGEQRKRRGKRIQAETLPGRHTELAALQLEILPDLVLARALTTDLFDPD